MNVNKLEKQPSGAYIYREVYVGRTGNWEFPWRVASGDLVIGKRLFKTLTDAKSYIDAKVGA
jgi:hypothetical protein